MMIWKTSDENRTYSLEEIEGFLKDLRASSINNSYNEEIKNLVLKLEGSGFHSNADFIRIISNGQKKEFTAEMEEWSGYLYFCQRYIIYIIKKYLPNEYDAERLLMAYGLLDGYDKEKSLGARRLAYAAASIGKYKYITKAWTNPEGNYNKLFNNKENPSIIALARKLAEEMAKRNGKLKLAGDIIAELKAEFPQGMPDKPPLPSPRYLKSETDTEESGSKAITEKTSGIQAIEDAATVDEVLDIMTDNMSRFAKKLNTFPEIQAGANGTFPKDIRKKTSLSKAIKMRRLASARHRQPSKKLYFFIAVSVSCIFMAAAIYFITTGSGRDTAATVDGTAASEKNDAESGESVVDIDPDEYKDWIADLGVETNDGDMIDVQPYETTYDPNGAWSGKKVEVEDGAEYIVRFCAVHGHPGSELAHNVKVSYSIPEHTSDIIRVDARLSSTDQNFYELSSYVDFHAENNIFHLEYVPGSARIYNSDTGEDGHVLSDAVISNGVLVGYDMLNGLLPAGMEYAGYVTIRVKAVFDTSYSALATARIKGTEDWSTSVNAEIGDYIEFRIEYENTSTIGETQSVVIKDVLPDNLQYVTADPDNKIGTTQLWNDRFPNGATAEQDGSVIANGIRIGDYEPGATAVVQFTAEVVDNSLHEGDNHLINHMGCFVGRMAVVLDTDIYVTKNDTKDESPED